MSLFALILLVAGHEASQGRMTAGSFVAAVYAKSFALRAAIEAGVGAYAVSEVRLKYLRPAKLDDDVMIETRCTEMRAASCRMHQTARRGDEVLAEAELRVGFVAPDGRPRRQPEEWRAAFARFMASNP